MSTNPFDFRRPIGDPPRFAGRPFVSRRVRAPLREHLLIAGPKKIGKTSALNVLGAAWRDHGRIVVDLPLNDAVLESPQHFFATLLGAAERAMSSGDLPEEQHLLLGAEFETGAFLLDRCRELGRRAADQGVQGIVVLIDRAELFSDDDDIFQVLHLLMERLENWTFVIAGRPRFIEEIDDVYPTLRTAAHEVRMGPFGSVGTVGDCLDRQLQAAGEQSIAIGFRARYEFAYASGGHPFLLMVLAHYAWATREESDAELTLSTRSLRRAIVELRRTAEMFPRDKLAELSEQLDVLDRLEERDVRAAAPLVHFEELSVEELATALCIRDGCDLRSLEANRESRMANLWMDLERLQRVGVVDVLESRFQLRGKVLARTYLTHLAQERDLDFTLPFAAQPTYGGYMGYLLTQRLRAEVTSIPKDIPELSGSVMVFDDPNAYRTAWPPEVAEFLAAAVARNAGALANAGVFAGFNRTSLESPDVPADAVLVCSVLQVRVAFGPAGEFGSESLVVGALSWASSDVQSVELEALLTNWAEETQSALMTARIEVVRVAGAVIDAATARRFIALVAPPIIVRRVLDLYRGGSLVAAAELLDDVLPTLSEQGKNRLPSWMLADLHLRLGFLRAALGQPRDAEHALLQARTPRGESPPYLSPNGLLVEYNLAYVRALKGEFAAAARVVEALRASGQDDTQDGVYLLLFMPKHPDWAPGVTQSNSMWVPVEHLRDTLIAQQLVYEALSGLYNCEKFTIAVAGIAASRSCSVNRLLAWLRWVVFGDVTAAIGHFEVAASAVGAPLICDQELAFARAHTGGEHNG